MMAASALLRSLLSGADYTGLSDADAVSTLNTPAVEYAEPEPYTIQGLVVAFGLGRVNTWVAAIHAAGLDWITTVLASKGLILSDPAARAQIDALHGLGVLSAEDASDIKALGIYLRSPWITAGGTGTVELADVQTARAELAREDLLTHVRARATGVVAAIESGSIATWDAARAALGAE